jgi:acetoin utilization protein AcuC
MNRGRDAFLPRASGGSGGLVTVDRCPVSVIWDDRFLEYDFGPGHPFTEKSRRLAVRLLEQVGFFAGPRDGPSTLVRSAPLANEAELLRFHEREYLAFVDRMGTRPMSGALDLGDTPSFPGCFAASSRIVGGTLCAWRIVQEGAGIHAFSPAGGLHHARPDSASGFCIFNDLGVAMRAALDSGSVRRIAYVDVDVHQGDGVMYGFYDDGRVLAIDFHQDGRTIFPGTGFPDETGTGDGAGLKVNVPLPPGAGDEAFIPLFERIVPPLLRSYRPEMILLQTGVDAHVGDRLGSLQYTPRSYHAAIELVHRLAHELCQGRLVETGGGGYAAQNVARVLARAAGVLAGRRVPVAEEDELPAAWRTEYEAATGHPSPFRWDEIPSRVPSPWRAEHGAELVHRLEQALGVRFP